MKLTNSIGWCDVTANPVIGCSPVSDGCKNCYAKNTAPARILRHRGVECFGPGSQRVEVKGFWDKLRRLNKLVICDACRETTRRAEKTDAELKYQYYQCPFCGEFKLRRIRCFANSLCDIFDDAWPDGIRSDLFYILERVPDLDVFLLTKRPPEPMEWRMLNIPNVWMGVSVENQTEADRRIFNLSQSPFDHKFISVEPLLEHVDLDISCFNGSDSFGAMEGISWVIVGIESGPARRYYSANWLVVLAQQCKIAHVPLYIKDRHDGHAWPASLQIQQFPKP